MRVFVFLLVLANLVFLAWTQGYLGQTDNPDAARLTQQIAADRLAILSRDQPPDSRNEPAPLRGEPEAKPAEAASKPAEAAAKPAESKPAEPKPAEPKPAEAGVKPAESAAKPDPGKCLAWAGLSVAEADAVDAVLAGDRFAALRRVRHSVPHDSSWWVFIPPQLNKAEAEKKAGEVKRLGITEYFVVQDAGPNRYAISLGIFSSEAAAEARLNALRAKGVRSAKVGPRQNSRAGTVTVEAAGPEALLGAARDAVQAASPEVKTVPCGKD